MKNKYVMIKGLAFSEESDMKDLNNYARQGWILDGISWGFFYRLKKGESQDIIYNLDYQKDINKEYFMLFKESGWDHVVSIGNGMHIFLAKSGTKPIYSDTVSEIDKYESIKKQTGQVALYSLFTMIFLFVLLVISGIILKPIFLLIAVLLMINFLVFIFNIMPYIAYRSRVNYLKKYGESKGETILNKINIFSGVVFIIIGILYLLERSYLSLVFIGIGISMIVSERYNKNKRVHK